MPQKVKQSKKEKKKQRSVSVSSRKSRSAPVVVSKRSTMSPVAAVAAVPVPRGFQNFGERKVAGLGVKTPVQKAIAQFLNPLGGALQRLPPGGSGQMSLQATGLASTYQVLQLTIPSDYATAYTLPQVALTYSGTGSLSATYPLYDFSKGYTMAHFWDSATPLVYPSFPNAPVTYVCTSFLNSPTSGFLVPAVTVGSPGFFLTEAVTLFPSVFVRTAGPTVMSSSRLPSLCGETPVFWMDSSTTLLVFFRPLYSGTYSSGAFTFVLTYHSGPSEAQVVSNLQIAVAGTSLPVSATFPAASSSGWYSISLTGGFATTAAPGVSQMSLSELSLTAVCSLGCQTNFSHNPAYVDSIGSLSGDRVLGSTVQIYCSSPVLQIGGRILAAVGHTYNDDFRLSMANATTAVDATSSVSFYDGPTLSSAGNDGGLYSVSQPKRAFVMEDVDTSDFWAPGLGRKAAAANLISDGKNNFGYNLIQIRPSFVSGTQTIAFEVILAQNLEYSTSSQFLQVEKTGMKQRELDDFIDLLRDVQPFCANPFHLKMVGDFIRKAGGLAMDALRGASTAIPMAAKIAAILGHPELSAMLSVAGGRANAIRNVVGA